jgi:tRNA-2-methylthio-N6-dimethylallyladenosine synthase
MISTDLIVGYPGETKNDFAQTVALLEEVRFSGAFSFKYSPRPGTPAAELDDDVPSQEKAERLAAVHQVVGRIEGETRAELVGQTLAVLIEGSGRNPGQRRGRARNGQIVNFVPEKNARLETGIGEIVEVEITGALPHSLEGRPVCIEGKPLWPIYE